jgi:hypothetical protein
MKKGFITLIACFFVMTALQSYAMAPVISTIPDIAISDAEDNEGLTVDLNWYRYENAFLLTSYVSDQDSDSDTWKVSFTEASSDNDIAINKKYQYTGADKSNPTENLGAGYLTFQDLVRSPKVGEWVDPAEGSEYPDPQTDPGDPRLLKYHDVDGNWADDGPRGVTLYVSDGVNVTSETFGVWSIDDAQLQDHLSGAGPQTVFTSDMSDWGTSTYPGTIAITFGTGSGFLTMTSGLNSGGQKYFGRWVTPMVNTYEGQVRFDPAYGDDFIYAALYKVKHDRTAGTLNNVPGLRFGATQAWGFVTLEQKLASFAGSGVEGANPVWPQTPDSEVSYVAYWDSNQDLPNFDDLANALGLSYDLRTWHVYIDLLNVNDTDQGTWTVSEYSVFAVDRPADLAQGDADRTDYDTPQFGTGAGQWGPYQSWQEGNITPTNQTGGILFDCSDNYGSGSYYAMACPDTFDWVQGKVVRLSAWFASASARTFSKARIRCGAAFGHLSQEYSVQSSAGVDAVSPGTTASQYSTYVASYGGPSELLGDSDADWFEWGVDFMATNIDGSGAAADVFFDAARVEVLDDMLGLD